MWPRSCVKRNWPAGANCTPNKQLGSSLMRLPDVPQGSAQPFEIIYTNRRIDTLLKGARRCRIPGASSVEVTPVHTRSQRPRIGDLRIMVAVLPEQFEQAEQLVRRCTGREDTNCHLQPM